MSMTLNPPSDELKALAKLADATNPNWRDVECMRLIHALMAEEGDEVLILCDNPDFNGLPNNAVECCGTWTNWADKRFTGESLLDALSAAWIEKTRATGATLPMPKFGLPHPDVSRLVGAATFAADVLRGQSIAAKTEAGEAAMMWDPEPVERRLRQALAAFSNPCLSG